MENRGQTGEVIMLPIPLIIVGLILIAFGGIAMAILAIKM